MMVLRCCAILSLAYSFVAGQDCMCPEFDFLPTDETNLAAAASDSDTFCNRPHDEDNEWFSPLYFDDNIGNTVIRYRYCAGKRTLTIFDETCGTLDSNSVQYTYTDAVCSDGYYTKTIPEDTNFVAFHGAGRSPGNRISTCGKPDGKFGPKCFSSGPADEIVRAYASKGTLCLYGYLWNPTDSDKSCWGNAESQGSTGDCIAPCYSRENPGQKHELLLATYDNGDKAFYVEVEVDPMVGGDGKDRGGGDSSGSTDGSNSSYLSFIFTLWAIIVLDY